MNTTTAHFDGVTYDPALDHTRLTKQLGRVYEALRDGNWHSLAAISKGTGDPEASVSARLRDLRKHKFGNHPVEATRLTGGLWLYRLNI